MLWELIIIIISYIFRILVQTGYVNQLITCKWREHLRHQMMKVYWVICNMHDVIPACMSRNQPPGHNMYSTHKRRAHSPRQVQCINLQVWRQHDVMWIHYWNCNWFHSCPVRLNSSRKKAGCQYKKRENIILMHYEIHNDILQWDYLMGLMRSQSAEGDIISTGSPTRLRSARRAMNALTLQRLMGSQGNVCLNHSLFILHPVYTKKETKNNKAGWMGCTDTMRSLNTDHQRTMWNCLMEGLFQ